MPSNVGPVTDERDGLVSFLAQQRLVLRTSAYGLTDEQASLAPTASSLSIGGLLKHLAYAERLWMRMVLQQPDDRSREERFAEHAENLRFGPDDSLADVLADYEAAAKETDSVIAGIPDLDQPVPVPRNSWFALDYDAWSVRWVLLHLIQETARHAGHADIVRESIDGATAFPLLAAAENWPPHPYVQPWKPKDS